MLFACEGFRNIPGASAENDVHTAAHTFANRMARQFYGRRAVALRPRLNSWTEDGRVYEFEAFVGNRRGDGVAGRNVWLTVRRVGA